MGSPGPGGLRRKVGCRVTDTQWPRYEVFVQEGPTTPHAHAGSVHAPDAEMAVLNARDVFVRRPECISLWVADARDVVARTAEHLGAMSASESQPGTSTPADAIEFAVFGKLDQKGTLVHLGSVQSRGASEAMAAAARRFGQKRPLALWVIDDARVTRSRVEDAEPLFEPARRKPFRDQAFYHIQTVMRRLKAGKTP